MKAVILAAGRGSRLGPLTENKPKCMVDVSGKPILTWITEALSAAGMEKIGVVRGYCAEKISNVSYVVFDNEKWSTTNMVVSLLCAQEWLSREECIISYADIIYSPETVLKLSQASGDIVIPYNTQWLDVWTKRFDDPLSDAETFKIDRNGLLQDIGGKASSINEIEGQYMGLIKLTPQGFFSIQDYIGTCSVEQVNLMDMTTLLSNLIKRNVKIRTLPVAGAWYEIDSEYDLRVYQTQINPNRTTTEGDECEY